MEIRENSLEMDEPSRSLSTNLTLQSRKNGSGPRSEWSVELLGAEASSHRTLFMFCFYAERNGKPMKAQLVSFIPKKKNAFDAMQRTALLLGRERNWRLGVRLGSGSCSSETRGFLQGVMMRMRV